MPIDRTHDIANTSSYQRYRSIWKHLDERCNSSLPESRVSKVPGISGPFSSISRCLRYVSAVSAPKACISALCIDRRRNANSKVRKSRYKEIHALLLSWEDDNLGVVNEIDELYDVFRQIYHFEVERWSIPSKRSHNTLAAKLLGFLADYESKDNLLIVYYGGHGSMNDDRQCVWSWYVLDIRDSKVCFNRSMFS